VIVFSVSLDVGECRQSAVLSLVASAGARACSPGLTMVMGTAINFLRA